MKFVFVYKELFEGSFIEPGEEGSVFYRKGLNWNNYDMGFETENSALIYMRNIVEHNPWVRPHLDCLFLHRKLLT